MKKKINQTWYTRTYFVPNFINGLLHNLNKSNSGAKIDNLTISSLGFADDIVVISDSPLKLQALINICY